MTFLLINKVIVLQHHPNVLPRKNTGHKLIWVHVKTVCLAVSVLCLGEGCLFSSFLLSFPPSPSRGKNESLSQQLVSVIPLHRPGFHKRPAAEALRSDITSPFPFYGHVHCSQRGLMIILKIRFCSFKSVWYLMLCLIICYLICLFPIQT